MIKKITLICCLISSMQSFAQSGIGFGPRVGLSMNKVDNSTIYGNIYKLHFNGGAFVNYHFNKYFGLKTEISLNSYSHNYHYQTTENYLKKLEVVMRFFGQGLDPTLINTALNSAGAFISDTIYNNYNGQATVRYLEIPLMGLVTYKGLQIGGGMCFGFAINSKAKQTHSQEVPILDVFEPILDTIPFLKTVLYGLVPQYKKPENSEFESISTIPVFNFGLVGDISYQFENNVTIGTRINYALATYHPAEKVVDRVRNIGLTFSLGYTFGMVHSSKPKAIYNLETTPVAK